MKDCKQIAAEWGLSERTVSAWGVSYRTVNNLCKEGTIPGAEKIKVPGRFLMMQRNHQMEGFLQENM